MRRNVIVLALVLAVWLANGAYARTFTDTTGTKFAQAVGELSDLGIITGDPGGTFRPADAVTRAEMAAIILRALGLESQAQGLTQAAAVFRDVRPGLWYSGYVALANQLGIVKGYVDGTFRPDAKVQYQEAITMLLRAVHRQAEADALAPWPAGYILLASQLGITNETNFANGQNASRGDVALMTYAVVYNVADATTNTTLAASVFHKTLPGPEIQLAGVRDGETYTSPVTPSWVATVPVAATLSRNGGPASVWFSGTTIRQGGSYVLTLTATQNGRTTTKSVSFVLDVWGQAAQIVLSGPTSVVANGQTKLQLTATVVDRDQNRVKDYTGQLQIAKITDGGAVDLPLDTTAAAAGGVATFTLTASTLPDATDTLQVTDTAGRLRSATFRITSVEPLPTSITVQADRPELSADGTSIANITATLVDQAGAPIVNATYPITLHISGAGTWADGTSQDIVPYTVNGTATAHVLSVYGQEGTVVVTASAAGVAAGSTSITTHVTGAPTAIELVADSTTLAADGTPAAYVRMQARVRDSHGHLVTGPAGAMSIYLDSTNRDEVGFFLDNTGDVFVGAGVLSVNTDRGVATFYAGARGTKLGPVTVSATGGQASHLTGASKTVTLVAGAPAAMSFMSLDRNDPNLGTVPITLSVANESFPFQVQVTDAVGNPVARAGIPVSFTVTDAAGDLPGSPGYSNQGRGTASPATAMTDANGQAGTSLTLQTYMSDRYVLVASADLNGDGTAETARTRTINVTDASVAAKVVLYLSSTPPNMGTNGQLDLRSLHQVSSYIAGGDPVYFVARVTDMNNNPVAAGGMVAFYVNDRYYGDDTTGSTGIPGVACVEFTGMSGLGTGAVTVRAVAASSPLAAPATHQLSIMAGRPASLTFSGQLWGTRIVRAGSVVPVTIQMLDEAGNPTVADTAYTLSLSSAAGDFRATPDGATLAQVTFPRGLGSMTVYIALRSVGSQTITVTNSTPGALGYGPFRSDTFDVAAAASVNWVLLSFRNTVGASTVDTIYGSTGAVIGYNQLPPKVQVWNGNTFVSEVTVATAGSFSIYIGEAPQGSAWTVRVYDNYGNLADERTLEAP